MASMDHQERITRPRAFSQAKSHRSERSADIKDSPTAAEDSAKNRRDSLWKGTSKANPNAAINEAQPGDVAAQADVTLDPLRAFQYKDHEGNVITEPDLSNPTRPRWERPLDTIRSFQNSIDEGYKRQSMANGANIQDTPPMSRRSSYLGNHYGDPRASPSRMSTQFYGGNYFDSGASPVAPPTRNRYGRRVQSTSNFGAYSHHYPETDQSSGSGNEMPRFPHANYGYSASNNIHNDEYFGSDSEGNGAAFPRSMRAERAPPVPAKTDATPARTPIQLGGVPSDAPATSIVLSSQGGNLPSTARPQPAPEEKRKSFFRRFSKG